MQTEAEAFLARIRAFPDDDAPRLVFADWLDEQNDPRGAFIRVQIALAQLAEEETAAGDADGLARVDREAREKLRAAEQELLAAHREEWTAPFRRLAHGEEFRRGFVEEVKVAARNLLLQPAELFDPGPLRHVHLLDVGECLPAVFQSPHLAPYLGRLNALTVRATHIGEPLARAVARSEYLAGLKRLWLTRNRFEDDAAGQLAASPVLAGLELLDLSENELGEAGARALAASAHLAGVRHLELGRNRLGPGGAEAVAASERLTALQRLGLAGNDIGAPRLLSLTRAGALLRVPALDLSANGIGPLGLQAVLARPPGPGVARLRELDLSHNELGDDGARILAQSPHLAELRVLRLANCAVGDDGARALAESPHLHRLVTLDLGNNPIGNPGFREYINTSNLPNLRQLHYLRAGLSPTMRRDLRMRFHDNRQ